ncbi:hypothetical protein ACWA1C_11710 [Flectobacillus roseus]
MGHLLQKIVDFFKRIKSERTFDHKKYDSQIKYVDYSNLYKPDNSFSDDFYSNLLTTISWTEIIVSNIEDKSQINYSTILRLTNPDYEGKPFYRYEGTWSGFAATPDISFNYLSVLQQALAVRPDKNSVLKDITQLGQILEFDIDLTTHDGAPCAESDGFVDESDIPPIDTWFYLTKTKLYCWIPTIFIEKMQGAIDVEIFDSYRWIKDSNPSLQIQTIDRLKAAYNIGIANSGA